MRPSMAERETGLFTVGVFQDVGSAGRALEALARHQFAPDALSVIATDRPAVAELLEQNFGASGETLDVRNMGTLRLHGSLVDALQGGAQDLAHAGVAATMPRVGFQAHDGYIFETLTARGGVLIAIRGEPRGGRRARAAARVRWRQRSDRRVDWARLREQDPAAGQRAASYQMPARREVAAATW